MAATQRGVVGLNLLAVFFASCVALGLAAPLMTADSCHGRGFQNAQGGHELASLGAGACAANNCSKIEDVTSTPGLTITWCGCNQQAGAEKSCSHVTTKCTPILLKNAGGSVWLACLNCDCHVTSPPQINGRCGVTNPIPVGLANASDTCVCVNLDD